MFASFLARTFHIQPLGKCSDTAVFPLPVPRFGLFGKQLTPKLDLKRWRRLCFQRSLHVVVMALNFIYGNMHPPPLALLGRRPNRIQKGIYKHLRRLLTACDQPGEFPLPPGRSGFNLIARVLELERFSASKLEFSSDLYGNDLQPGSLPKKRAGEIAENHRFRSGETYSPAQPYRSLDTSRLKLSGTGQWPMGDHLDSFLWLFFREPKILAHGLREDWSGPSVSFESKEENLRLLKLWDSRGLLFLFHGPHPSGYSCRIFNNHKSKEVDRQIGDRR